MQLRADGDELPVLRLRGGLHLVADRAPALLQARHGLLQRGALRGGRGEDGGLGDADHDVVERLDVAIGGQKRGDGARAGVGGAEQRGQRGVEVALDGGYIGDLFRSDGAGRLPLVRPQGGERLLEALERGAEDC